MKKINVLFAGLTLSFAILSGLAFEQTTSANLPAPGLGCDLLTGCLTSSSCPGRGTANGCTITCEHGGTVTCPTKP